MKTIIHGFTLIELLIVVAIIAILAAIAVPNFLEARTRSHVTKVKADERSIATALQSYQVDYGRLPDVFAQEYPHFITTPVAYISSVPFDYFFFYAYGSIPGYQGHPYYLWTRENWGVVSDKEGKYGALYPPYSWMVENTFRFNRSSGGSFILRGWGPVATDYSYVFLKKADAQSYGFYKNTTGMSGGYDPTNGTLSAGQIQTIY
jgi:prepilin-type N-terminal cleavage/methylation domain-containing protein